MMSLLVPLPRRLHCTHFNFQAIVAGRQSGTSLVGILTGLGVAGVLAGLGAGIGGIIQNHATTTQINSLIGDLAFMRTMAIKTGTTVTLCVSADGQHCTKTASWSAGWIIFTDENRNRRIDGDDRLLRIQGRLATGTSLQYGTGYYRYLMYNARGMVFPGATFTFCGAGDYRRAIVVYWTGRPRISLQGPGGRELTCSTS